MCGCLLCAPYWGPGPQPRHVPYTENRTSNTLVHRPKFNPLSHSSKGEIGYFFTRKKHKNPLELWKKTYVGSQIVAGDVISVSANSLVNTVSGRIITDTMEKALCFHLTCET